MKGKTILRLITDGLMSGAVLLSIANTLTGNAVHETIGLLMSVLFLLHQFLNRRWYRTLFMGRYDTLCTVNTVVNGLLLIAFAVLVGSSVMISRTLFPLLDIDGSLILRQLHTTTAYWFLILMAVHFGIHWPRFVKRVRKVLPVFKKIRVHTNLKWLVAIVIMTTGIYSSFDRNLGGKLFMTYAFDFWDFDQSVSGFFIHNLCIIGLYAVITHLLLTCLPPVKSKNDHLNNKSARKPIY